MGGSVGPAVGLALVIIIPTAWAIFLWVSRK